MSLLQINIREREPIYLFLIFLWALLDLRKNCLIAPILFFNYNKYAMHGARVFFSDQNLNPTNLVEGTNTHFEHLFKSFIHNFNR